MMFISAGMVSATLEKLVYFNVKFYNNLYESVV